MSLLAMILLSMAVLLVVLMLLLLFFSWRQARALTHPPRKLLTTTPTAQGLAYEDVHFTTEDGITISAWFIPPRIRKGSKTPSLVPRSTGRC